MLEHQETFSSPIILSMRNLPSFPTSVIKTVLPKPQIMIIAVSLPIELFNKKVRCRGGQLLWELFKSSQGKRILNGPYELQEWGSFKVLHNTDQIYLNLLPHLIYFISDLSDSLGKSFRLAGTLKASFLSTIFSNMGFFFFFKLSFKNCTNMMS